MAERKDTLSHAPAEQANAHRAGSGVTGRREGAHMPVEPTKAPTGVLLK